MQPNPYPMDPNRYAEWHGEMKHRLSEPLPNVAALSALPPEQLFKGLKMEVEGQGWYILLDEETRRWEPLEQGNIILALDLPLLHKPVPPPSFVAWLEKNSNECNGKVAESSNDGE